MRFLFYHLAFIFVCFFAYSAQSQTYDRTDRFLDDAAVFGKNNLAVNVICLFQNGFEINYDRKIADYHWVKIVPTYYRKHDYSETSIPTDMKLVQGIGFKLHHKYFPYRNSRKKTGLFLDYGPMFQQFDLTNKAGKQIKFNKIGAECLIGVQKVFADVFFLEFYAGIAGNILQNKSEEGVDKTDALKEHNQFWFETETRQMWFDYSTSGNYLVFSFNIGYLF